MSFGAKAVIEVLIRAAKCLPYQLSAILQEVGTDLTAGLREGMEGVQVDVMGKLRDNAVALQISSALAMPSIQALNLRIAS